jgi:hypothetical protein
VSIGELKRRWNPTYSIFPPEAAIGKNLNILLAPLSDARINLLILPDPQSYAPTLGYDGKFVSN